MNLPNDELELLRRLRQLPREREPARDLWVGIEARLGATRNAMPSPRARGWAWTGLAAAASLALAIGLASRPAPIATQSATSTTTQIATQIAAPMLVSGDAPNPGNASNQIVRREAEAITIEYRLALEPFAAAPLPPELDAAATELDVSAQQLRRALREQPDAIYLLDRLRRTYDQRRKLTQRAMLG